MIEIWLGTVHELRCHFFLDFWHPSPTCGQFLYYLLADYEQFFTPTLFIPDIFYERSLIISLSMWLKLGYLSIGKLTFYIRFQLWYLNTFPRVSWHWRDHSCLWIVLYGPSQPENKKKSKDSTHTSTHIYLCYLGS